MKLTLLPFDFEGKACQVVVDDQGTPWWVAKDVCEILGVQNVPQAMAAVDEDEKRTYSLYISGQNREVWTISESGLWSLVLRSNKPEAKKIKRWITSEVIPSIRKHGSYGKPSTQLQADSAMLRIMMLFTAVSDLTANDIAHITELATAKSPVTGDYLAVVDVVWAIMGNPGRKQKAGYSSIQSKVPEIRKLVEEVGHIPTFKRYAGLYTLQASSAVAIGGGAL